MTRSVTESRSVLAVTAMALALASCDGGTGIAPPTIRFGRDVCGHCHMIISDDRFAAARVVGEEDGRYAAMAFDDVGCLLEYEQGHPDESVVVRYVRDYTARDWLDAGQAFFVHSDSIHSPMASGVAGCRTEQDATDLAERSAGRLMRLDELRSRARAGKLRIDPDAGPIR